MRRRSRVPAGIGLVLLIAVPLFELWLLIQVGQWIGVLPTVAIVIAEALLGGWLTKREGRAAWRALNSSVAEGRMPNRELADAALILIGGLLLIVPGFLTDLLGLICLMPFSRPLARTVLGYFLTRRLAGYSLSTMPGLRGPGDLIEGEVVPEAPTSGASAARSEPLVIRGELER